MKLNRYTIGRWIRNLKWDYRNLYHAFCAFVTMICVVYVGFLFFGPMVLAGFCNTGWFLLLEFITIPTIIGALSAGFVIASIIKKGMKI